MDHVFHLTASTPPSPLVKNDNHIVSKRRNNLVEMQTNFYDRMTVHRDRFLVNKTNRCTEYQFYWYYYSTCFGQPYVMLRVTLPLLSRRLLSTPCSTIPAYSRYLSPFSPATTPSPLRSGEHFSLSPLSASLQAVQI